MVFEEMDAGPVLIIGHRGAAGLRPENTLPSFSEALAQGVNAVELDVHCVEGELVVIHDEKLERTTNGRGLVADAPLMDLRRLDAGAGARVPLLREVFELLPTSVGINVELKGTATAPALAEFLNHFTKHDVLVSSFDHDELRTFRQAREDVSVAPLFGRWRSSVWEVARELRAWSINLSARIATRQRIADAHTQELRVLVYTVNDIEVARQLADCGVDGVFTDHPDRINLAALSG